jgi:hypothetical protein
VRKEPGTRKGHCIPCPHDGIADPRIPHLLFAPQSYMKDACPESCNDKGYEPAPEPKMEFGGKPSGTASKKAKKKKKKKKAGTDGASKDEL